jgi:hypothetical protein
VDGGGGAATTVVLGAGAGLSTVFSDLIEQAEATAATPMRITKVLIAASWVARFMFKRIQRVSSV